MSLCKKPLSSGVLNCQKPLGHSGRCCDLPAWGDLQPHGMAQVQQVSDKVKRSPTETAGKGGEWGFLQNKVNRASNVAIPFDVYLQFPAIAKHKYDAGFLIYVAPEDYFSGKVPVQLQIGRDYIVLYTSSQQLERYPPLQKWKIFTLLSSAGASVPAWNTASSWIGDYYVRTKNGQGWNYGPGIVKAIGIRQDEYCSKKDQYYIVGQMSYLAWSMKDTRDRFGVKEIPQYIIDFLANNGMLDLQRMKAVGMINANGVAQCPFCRKELSFQELVNQAPQQLGRQLLSSNATALHLMHIEPLRMGEFNHRPYNLAFGHAKCNHAQGEDSIKQSIEFLFGYRLKDVAVKLGISKDIQEQMNTMIML